MGTTQGELRVNIRLVRVRDALLISADREIASATAIIRGSTIVLVDRGLALDVGEDIGDVRTLILNCGDGQAVLECFEGLCIKRGEL